MALNKERERLLSRIAQYGKDRDYIVSVLSHLDTVDKCNRMNDFLDYAREVGDRLDVQTITIAAINIDNGV